MDDCTFCQIVNHEIPASMVFEDDHLLGFLTIQPVNPGHILLIPKLHYQYIDDLPEPTGAHLFTIAMRLQTALRKSGVPCEGVNLWLCDGAVAGQEVGHLYLHIFPRLVNDSFRISAAWHVAPSPQERDQVTDAIAEAYQKLFGEE